MKDKSDRREFLLGAMATGTLLMIPPLGQGMVQDGNTHFTFKNWDHTISCRPKNYFQPCAEAEVVQIVKDTYKRGGVVRTFGAGHSWSSLVPSDDSLINLDRLDKLVAIDDGKMRVTVQAGIRIQDLVKLLRKHGLGMKNLGSIKKQSIAGAVSTGTHGTGRAIGNISTQIVGLQLVNGFGEVLTISEDQNQELLAAARLSLGSLGIITEVTIQCVKDYDMLYGSSHRPFEYVIEHLDDYLNRNERLRLYWFSAFRERVRVMTMNPPSVAVTRGDAGAKAHFIRAIEKLKRYDKALTVTMPPRHQESEYAVPIENAARAVRALRQMIIDSHYVDLILVEVRFVEQDDILLSPSNGRRVCYVGGYIFGKLNAGDFFKKYEELMKSFGGRPHWGKHLTLSQQEARDMYPTTFDRFNRIRKDLDPNQIFANDFIRGLFG